MASADMDFPRLTWISPDLVSVDMAWTVRGYPGCGDQPVERRSGLSSMKVARRDRGWMLDLVEVRAA